MLTEKRDESVIVLRVSRQRKAAYVRAAQPGTLADWIFQRCDGASGFTPGQADNPPSAPDPRTE